MKIQSIVLLGELRELTLKNIVVPEELKNKSSGTLNYRTAPASWTALECIEHLNFYGDYYLSEIGKQTDTSPFPAEEIFKSGRLGNYFAKSMRPGQESRKMKTLKSSNPLGKVIGKEVIDHFIEDQNKILDLLKKAERVSLTRTKTGTSIAGWIKLRLGDTLRVVIYHNQRHLLQAQRAVQSFNTSAAPV
ncbi:DinB family protein [Salinimicrobium flavum]|uniref:DinB family protein n=1 Tax=Salinimicrobium flavum TaxID=1737065 RepID=A0ABW5IWP9_9FLAO